MATFEVTLIDRTIERVEADGYQQEGPMTTFFASDVPPARLTAWAERLASFRSADIAMIRKIAPAPVERAPDLDGGAPQLVVVAG